MTLFRVFTADFSIAQAKAENMKEGFLLRLEILYLSVS